MFEKKKYFTDKTIEKMVKCSLIKSVSIAYKNTTQGFRDYGKGFPLIHTLNPELTFYIVLGDGQIMEMDCTKLAKTYKINSIYLNSVKVR